MIERRIPPALSLLVALVSLAGFAVLIGAGLDWSSEEETLLIALAGLTVASELLDFSPFPNSRVSMSIALIFVAGTLGGLPGVATVASTAALADYAAHRKPVIKAVFNEGVLLASGAAFVGVIELWSPASGDWLAFLAPTIIGAIVAFAINSGLVAIAITLDTGGNLVKVWRSAFSWMLPHYVMLGVLALLIAAAYDRWELPGIALLLAPLAMAWLMMKQGTPRVVRQESAPEASRP